jgi:hypothetical protein
MYTTHAFKIPPLPVAESFVHILIPESRSQAGGYECLYKALDQVFGRKAPDYTLFGDERFEVLLGR